MSSRTVTAVVCLCTLAAALVGCSRSGSQGPSRPAAQADKPVAPQRADGLPEGAVWLQEGRVRSYPETLALPGGLREATGVRRLLRLGPQSLGWIQETGEGHQGFCFILGDMATMKSTTLVSGTDPFDFGDPEWDVLAANLAADGGSVVLSVREPGNEMITSCYRVALASPGKPEAADDAVVFSSLSGDGSVRALSGWEMPGDGGAHSDRWGYVEVQGPAEAKPRRLWEIGSASGRPPWADMIDAVAVSPDGTQLAYTTSTAVWLVKLSPAGATPSQLMQVPDGQSARDLTWTPDGRHLYLDLAGTGGAEGGTSSRLDLPVGSPTPLPEHLQSLVFVK